MWNGRPETSGRCFCSPCLFTQTVSVKAHEVKLILNMQLCCLQSSDPSLCSSVVHHSASRHKVQKSANLLNCETHPERYHGFLIARADADEPPRSDAGQDVAIQLPTDWAVLDGRDSLDDHGISHYEWTLVRGDTAINMKVGFNN